MASVADLIVRIRTQNTGKKDIDDTATATSKWKKRTDAAAAGLAVASAAVVAFGVASVKSASRTQQAMGGIEAVFGKNADTVKKWASNAADSVGLAKSEYAEFAAVIGSNLKGAGLPLDQVASKTNDLIKLGADLAATYGGSTADAVDALSSALKGEFDPMDKYGTKLSAAAIKAQMVADGTDKLTGAAASQAQTMATLALITAKTADAHGQYAQQQNSAAEQAQRASAQFENMKSALGEVLLPVVTTAAKVLGDLAKVMSEHPKAAQIAAAAILAMTAAIMGLIVASKIYSAVVVIMGAESAAAWVAALWPILLVVAAVAAVTIGIIILWKKSSAFRGFVLGMWAAIRGAAVAVAHAVVAAWSWTWGALRAGAAATGAFFRAIWNAIRTAAVATANAVRGAWGAVVSAVSNVAAHIRSAFTAAFDAVRRAAAGVASAVAAPFHAIQSAINGVIGAIQSLIGWLGRIKVPKISLPKIPGVGRSAPATATASAPVDLGARVAAPIVGPATSAGSATVVINITGAVDPESTARQIRRLLAASDIRHGASTRGLRTA